MSKERRLEDLLRQTKKLPRPRAINSEGIFKDEEESKLAKFYRAKGKLPSEELWNATTRENKFEESVVTVMDTTAIHRDPLIKIMEAGNMQGGNQIPLTILGESKVNRVTLSSSSWKDCVPAPFTSQTDVGCLKVETDSRKDESNNIAFVSDNNSFCEETPAFLEAKGSPETQVLGSDPLFYKPTSPDLKEKAGYFIDYTNLKPVLHIPDEHHTLSDRLDGAKNGSLLASQSSLRRSSQPPSKGVRIDQLVGTIPKAEKEMTSEKVTTVNDSFDKAELVLDSVNLSSEEIPSQKGLLRRVRSSAGIGVPSDLSSGEIPSQKGLLRRVRSSAGIGVPSDMAADSDCRNHLISGESKIKKQKVGALLKELDDKFQNQIHIENEFTEVNGEPLLAKSAPYILKATGKQSDASQKNREGELAKDSKMRPEVFDSANCNLEESGRFILEKSSVISHPGTSANVMDDTEGSTKSCMISISHSQPDSIFCDFRSVPALEIIDMDSQTSMGNSISVREEASTASVHDIVNCARNKTADLITSTVFAHHEPSPMQLIQPCEVLSTTKNEVAPFRASGELKTMTTSPKFNSVHSQNVVKSLGSNDIEFMNTAPNDTTANQESNLQVPVQASGTRAEDDVKVCDICGDTGFEEMLAVCSECSEGAEHIYCMQTLMEAVPENNWFCECCKLKMEAQRQDILGAYLLPSRSGCSKFVSSKNDQGTACSRLSARLEKGKVVLNRKAVSRGHSTSAKPAKRTASDVLNISNKMPNIGITGSIQQPVGISGSRQIVSRKDSLKVPEIGKVKFLSTRTLTGGFTGGAATSSIARSLSGRLSKAIAVSSPKTVSVPLAGMTIKCDFPSSSIIEKIGGAAESARKSEVLMSVSCTPAATNASLLQCGAAKQVVSHRSSYEELPSFLLSSKPPNMLKAQAPLKCYRDVSVGGYATQLRDKLSTGHSVQSCTMDLEKSPTQRISPEPDHKVSIEVSRETSADVIKAPEQNFSPDTPCPVDPFLINQKMYGGHKIKQVSDATFQLAEDSGSADAHGNACLLNIERHTDGLQVYQSKALADAAHSCTSEKCMSEIVINTSVGQLDTSPCLQTSYTKPKAKEEGILTVLNPVKSGPKPCAESPHTNDIAKFTDVETYIGASTSGVTASVQNSETMQVIAKDCMLERKAIMVNAAGTDTSEMEDVDEVIANDCILERKVIIVNAAGTDTSEMEDMDEENKEQKSMPSLSWCSDFVPSLGQTRCYKCKEMGHSAQNCQSRSNSYMLDLSKSGGRAPANVTHSNQTPFSCVDATINTVVVSRGGTKILEPTHIGLGGADFSAKATSLSFERLPSLGNLQMQAEELNSSEFRASQEAGKQCVTLSDVKRPGVLSRKNPPLYDNLNNMSGWSSPDKIGYLEKDRNDQASISFSAVCKPSLYPSSESRNPLQHVKSDEELAAPTAGNSLENIQRSFWVQLSHCSTPIVIPETLSTQVHHSEGPMKVSCMASCVPMVSRGLLPERKSPCSEVFNAGKVSIERGTIDLEIETMGIRAVPFPGRATFGVTITRAPAIPEPNYLWRGGFQVVANGKLPVFYDGIEAHASSRAINKVYQATRGLPSILQLEAVQRGNATDSWPKLFVKKPPSDESIALYFFATNDYSFERFYRPLLDHMIVHDLALKGRTDAAELLLFPSSLLPEQFQRWNQIRFLWGVFRGKKALKVDDASDTPSLGLPDLGGHQASNVLPSIRPHVAEGSTLPIPPVGIFTATSNAEVADMDVDMEGGKEVGIVDQPVKKLVAPGTEPTSLKMDILSVLPQGSQSQQVAKVLEQQDSSCEVVPALTVSTVKPLSPSCLLNTYHSYENDDKLDEVGLPPGFGPLTNAPAITSDLPPGFDNCNKILDKENDLSTQSGHVVSKRTKAISSRALYASVQHSAPFACSPTDKDRDTSLLRSHSYRHRYADSGSESSGHHKRRGKMLERDKIDRNKYGEKLNHRDFGKASSYRREQSYRDDREMDRRKERESGARYWDRDKKNNAIRMHRERRADYRLKERRLNRRTFYSGGHNKSYSCSHSRSQSQSRSPFKERNRSRSPLSRCGRRSGRHRGRHRSRSVTTSLDSDRKRHSVRRHQSQVKRGEPQEAGKDIQAGGRREHGRDSINKAFNSAQGSLVEKHAIHGIKGRANEVKDKPAKQQSIPLEIMVTEVCDSSQEGLAMAESVTKELTGSSENKQLLQSSEVIPYHLFIEEEASQEVTVVSEISSAAERSFFPCSTGVVTIDNFGDYAQPGIEKEQLVSGWQLAHGPEKDVISLSMEETGLYNDVGMSIAPTLKLPLCDRQSSPHKGEPLSLFSEQVGVLRAKCHSASSQRTPFYMTNSSSSVCEKLKLYGIGGDKFSSLDLTLAVPGEKTGVSQVFVEEHDEGFQVNDLDFSLKL
ncbi:hypothetical protein O6H91_08G088400 [Diphasiastrum complanatum]|uniref:Uncharacterized protein n=1 Tax=Diphasiastrum complanatum TaxID=34168 RepID=A0ACC2CZS5_DIPCM|nr:hypothetical protein O6H91_08G088400 [Diphasiastrum complanatum]